MPYMFPPPSLLLHTSSLKCHLLHRQNAKAGCLTPKLTQTSRLLTENLVERHKTDTFAIYSLAATPIAVGTG